MNATLVSHTYHLFVGIDIAADTFTVAWSDGCTPARKPATYAQTPAGFGKLHARLHALAVAPEHTLAVLEATSTYWVALAVDLHQAGFHVAVINPAQAANYIRSLPRRAKTDGLDAQCLAHYAQERLPPCWTPPPAIYHELRQRLTVRDALLATRVQVGNQRHALLRYPVVVPEAVAHLDAVLADLAQRITTLELELIALLGTGAWAESAALLQTIPGIGPITTAWLLVTTLNCTLCPTADAATAFAGLAPLTRQSGTSVHGHHSLRTGGSRRLRTAL